MRFSYTYHAQAVDSAPLQDGVACVYNGMSDGLVEVRSVYLYPAGGGNPVVGVANLAIQRISAMTAGSGIAVSPVKMDTNANDPADVAVVCAPDAVTPTDFFRRLADCPAFSTTTANASLASKVLSGGNKWQPLSSSDFFRAVLGTDIEPIILRPNEGFALMQTAWGKPHAMRVELFLCNTVTGSTYVYRSAKIGTTRRLDKAILAVMNTHASDVYEVCCISVPDDGDSNQNVRLRLLLIDGYEGGDDTEVFSRHDTAVPVPAGLKAVAGPFRAKPAGENFGAPIDWHTGQQALAMPIAQQHKMGRLRNRTFGPLPYYEGAPSAFPMGKSFLLFDATGGQDGGIILRPGQGLAIVVGSEGSLENSTFSYYEASFHLSVSPPMVCAQSSAVGL